MQYMGLNEIREKYLSFFESKGHLRQESFPLVPIGDNSLLLINSGMAPLKPYFTGEQTPPRNRMTSCQKCIRTPDIERVGKTSRHGTFFEMLGNFSFGDYFKIDATRWAWEFITEVMEIPKDKLYISVYLDDDEAWDIWTKGVGIEESHMVRLGKADNFWEIGSGPCGPCSEIYFDRGEEHSCGSSTCAVGCDCDRYVEFWNLVFTQYNNDGNDNYTPLEKKNIDTGMGLERLACIMQGVQSLFDVDTVMNITKHISKVANKNYGENDETDVSLRVITDHIRSTVMMVCDGVIPSNEGRGYVLRRLLRRAARHGKLLGVDKQFLFEVAQTVIAESAGAYPQLREKEGYIVKVIKMEEERFDQTIDAGLKILDEMMENATESGVFSSKDAFKLYDTFGFPIDLTLEILEEKNLTLDRDKFDALMLEQKQRARAAREKLGDLGWAGEDLGLDKSIKTSFVGYEKLENTSKIIALLSNGELRQTVDSGENVMLVLEETAFYAESGGQNADKGIIKNDTCTIEIINVKKTPDGKFLHIGEVIEGSVNLNDEVVVTVDTDRRNSITRAHTAAHLLHKALKTVLGDHVAQAGSMIEEDNVRFDFSHFSGMSDEEIIKVENIVNDSILAAYNVTTKEMPIKEAKEAGAVALFGEKYGDVVRVVKAEDFSVELCGGTHVNNTAKVGLFKIISESSVAAGVRRVEAYTGKNVLKLISSQENTILNIAKTLKTTPGEVALKADQLVNENKEILKNAERLSARLANFQVIDLFNFSKEVKGVNIIAVKLDDVDMETLRNMGDNIKEKAPKMVAILSIVNDDKINFLCVCGKEAVKMGAHAGKIVKSVAAICGGGGGGRPDSATAGGKDVTKLETALEAANNIVADLL